MMTSLPSNRHDTPHWGVCYVFEDVVVWVTIGEMEKLQGHPGMCRNCPIARAVQNVLLPGFVVEVGLTYATILDLLGNVVGGFSLTKYMLDFIRAFDSPGGYSQAVPFSTIVNLPRRAVRADAREAMTHDEWISRNEIARGRWEGLFS